MKVELRPFEEWEITEEPLMKDFLEPTIRERAMAEHERRWAKLGDPNRPKQSKSKHRASDYLLSELFFAKQDGGKLTGIPCGRKGKPRLPKHFRPELSAQLNDSVCRDV